MFTIKKAGIDELPIIMDIIEAAREHLKAAGSPQWQDGYGPDEESMEQAIHQQICWVGLLDGHTVAVACLVSGEDPVYTAIQEGSWLTTDSDQYVSIHRFAVSSDFAGQGIATRFLEALKVEALKVGYRDLRIDTYPKNYGMIRVIEKNGFQYRGKVYFPIPNGERVAFQLIKDQVNAVKN